MNQEQTLEFIQNKCKDVGASDFEIYFETRDETFIKTSKMKLERITHQLEKGVGVRIFSGNKVGSFYSSNLDPEVLETQIQRTFLVTDQLEPEEGAQLPDKSMPADNDLNIYDKTFENTSLDEKIKLVLNMESQAESIDARIVTHFNLYQEALREVTLLNSHGFNESFKSSEAVLYCAAVTKSEKVGTRIDAGDTSRFYQDLATSTIGRKAAEKAITLISDARIASATMPVLFDPEMACDLLQFYSSAFSAENIQKKQSFLAGQLHKPVAAEIINIVDDGLIPGRIGTLPFDAEGNTPVKQIVVDQGICQSFLHNEHTARKDKVSSTGNAIKRSYRLPASIQPSNFFMKTGNQDPADILSNIGRGILVLAMTNTGGVDIVSGDFSVEARGILIENGKKTTPLNNLVMSGKLQDILMNVKALGNDFEWNGRFGAPTILVENMVISA